MKFPKSVQVGQCLRLADDLADAQGTLHAHSSLTLYSADSWKLCQTFM